MPTPPSATPSSATTPSSERAEARPRAGMPAVPAPRGAPPRHPAPARPETHGEPGQDEADDLSALAWIVRAVTHVPGVLRLRGARLSFESTRGVLFDGSAAELALAVGRNARAGLQVTVGSERLAVHVVRPSGGVAPCAELVDRLTGGTPSTRGDAASWRPWQARLAPADGPARPARRTPVRRAISVFAPSC